MELYNCCKPLVVKAKVSDVRIQMLVFSDFENGCMQGSFLKRTHALLGTHARNQKGHFDGCTQRTFGQRMCARYVANPGCAQPTLRATPLTANRLYNKGDRPFVFEVVKAIIIMYTT